MNNNLGDEYYTKLIRSSSENYQKVGWGSKESQNKRFKVFTEMIFPEGKEILDIGSGLGCFWSFLKDQNYDCVYTGWDCIPEMVKEATRIHPDVKFAHKNILNVNIEEQAVYDYVVLSGALNFAVERQKEAVFNSIRNMFFLSKEACLINLLSINADYFEPCEWYADPGEILNFAFTLTRRVILRHDYMPHDFTICLYHE